ncbi:MAG: hypothetical protein Q7W16_03130 [Coriobacteriia bacterium]|nr:hypothetical protein [Coriobacteriia bacterium]
MSQRATSFTLTTPAAGLAFTRAYDTASPLQSRGCCAELPLSLSGGCARSRATPATRAELEAAGFGDVRFFGDHTGKEFEPTVDESVIVTSVRV